MLLFTDFFWIQLRIRIRIRIRIRNVYFGSGSDPDPAKSFGSIRIRIRNTALGGEGHGVQGQKCDILRPQLAMNRFLPLSLFIHLFQFYSFIIPPYKIASSWQKLAACIEFSNRRKSYKSEHQISKIKIQKSKIKTSTRVLIIKISGEQNKTSSFKTKYSWNFKQ